MVNDFSNMNKTNNHLTPQLIEPDKIYDIWLWKFLATDLEQA